MKAKDAKEIADAFHNVDEHVDRSIKAIRDATIGGKYEIYLVFKEDPVMEHVKTHLTDLGYTIYGINTKSDNTNASMWVSWGKS